MKSLVFDTGPVISLAINNLLFALKDLKNQFNGDFYITSAVKQELVDKPIRGKKYEFGALRVMQQIKENNIQIVESDEIDELTRRLLDIANSIYSAKGQAIKLVH